MSYLAFMINQKTLKPIKSNATQTNGLSTSKIKRKANQAATTPFTNWLYHDSTHLPLPRIVIFQPFNLNQSDSQKFTQ